MKDKVKCIINCKQNIIKRYIQKQLKIIIKPKNKILLQQCNINFHFILKALIQ